MQVHMCVSVCVHKSCICAVVYLPWAAVNVISDSLQDTETLDSLVSMTLRNCPFTSLSLWSSQILRLLKDPSFILDSQACKPFQSQLALLSLHFDMDLSQKEPARVTETSCKEARPLILSKKHRAVRRHRGLQKVQVKHQLC